MEYLSSLELSKMWNISERRVVQLCLDHRIAGAIKSGKTWAIPATTQKPVDARIKTGRYIKKLLPLKIDEVVNSIFEADCLEAMHLIPDESVDMILCDLPYGITQNAWDSYIPLDLLWKHYTRIIKPNGAIALTSSGVFTANIIMSQPHIYKYKWVWEKSKPTNFLNAKKQPLRKHEDICIFYKKQPVYNPQMTQGVAYDKGVRKAQLSGSYGDFEPAHVHSSGERYPTDVIYIKTAESEGKVYHPTQKPIELGRYLIRTYTNEGDIVLDNSCGSGSFLVSALLEKRNFIGIEKNENVSLFKKEEIDYIDVSKQRLKCAWDSLSVTDKQSLLCTNLLKEFSSGEVNEYERH